MPFMTLVCLLFTACNKDDILPGGPMLWTYEILTPESVEYEGGTVGWIPKECFKANGNEGYIVMTCKNFDMLNPISGGSYTYDCGWATLKVEANQLKIHFPRQVSEAPDAYEEITISTNDGKRTASTIICLSRTFKDEGQPDPEPEPLPEEAKFKMKKAYFTRLCTLTPNSRHRSIW